jgi:hypothetical protein
MVRTQVYLPREIYKKLQQRAEKYDLTLAVQIRTALEDYLDRAETEEDDGILRADDPIFKMIGMFDSGLGDLSINHDHYLYGAPKVEETPLPPRMREKASRIYKTRRTKRGRPKK